MSNDKPQDVKDTGPSSSDHEELDRARMLRILSECNQTVVRATEEPALLQDICRIIVDLGGYSLAWVGFAEQDTAQTVRPVAQAGFEDGYLESVNSTWADTERGQGPTGRAIRSGQPCIARDIQSDPDLGPWQKDALQRGYASCIALPLRNDDRVFGALNICAPVADAFHAQEVHLLIELASDLAFGITSLRERAERKRAEETLILFRSLIDHANDIIEVADPETGRFLDLNERACLAHGYTREEYLALTVPQINAVVATRSWKETVDELRRSGSLIRESQHRRKDGSTFPVEVNISYVRLERDYVLSVVRDITQRKQAEDELRENREAAVQFSEQLAALQEVTNELSKAKSSDDLCLLAVRLGRSRLGFDRVSIWFIEEHLGMMRGSFGTDERGELRDERNAQVEFRHEGLAWHLFSHNEPMALVEHCPLYDHLGRQVGEGDNALAALWDGDEVTGVICVDNLFTGQPIRERQIEVLQLYATTLGHLITRKRAEEALQRSEEKYRVLVENLNEVVFTVDRQGIFTYISPAIERYTGFSTDQVIGQPFTRFVHPDDLPGLVTSFGRSLVGQLEPYEFRVYGKDGTVRYMHTSSRTLVENGQVVGLTGVLSDMTGRKKAAEALRESEERYRALYEDNPSMYFTVDRAGTVLSVNQFGCEQLGYTAPELVGHSVLKVFHDEDRDAAARSVARCVENPGQVFHWELRKVHKAGNVLWVKETARAMRGPDGQVVVFIVCEDITERRLAEEERANLQAQLFQAQKMEVLGRLAGGVAHDFNNMLFAILGHTELAMRLSNPVDPIHEYLKVIEESTYRSADLVRQLLAFARKQTVAPRVLDLNDTVAGMLKMLRRLIGEDIHLVWMPGASVWPVRIDPSQIDQLLANLCVNARDAIAGVGKVTIETRNAVFDEAYCAVHPGFVCGQFVMLAVSDDGCGMTQDVMEHLFEPFFTTKEVGKGTGLGLATVYGIVKQNEGFINVYSEPRQGSTFKVYLPRFAGQAVELEAVGVPEMPRSHGETVLLVEDEAAILKVGQTMLRELGYQVLAAGTPGEALRQAQDHSGEIHILITDVVMPEMSGRDLAHLLGQVRPVLKVLFTSGYTGDVISHHGVLDEGVHFLQKPFAMRDLATKVRQVLDRESTDRAGG